ncbi:MULTISPECIES: translesion error-prone DNA polymerase V autoproteolytic subunit [Enterobacterales]|jgi:DNA polymerase V|uniref:translesion error-prone DNA polymerase V autoproteolytic subunit n=1 Tax=Enterobacterales TaxID=91347 RepID=UPI00064833F2|nr:MULTISPECIES: translesion error-prone DNA polymerase V autoproteolytic subunit [Yersiniaceae]MDW5500032.1 translesion error-prone DNA polymerase V autoproteolytic subunit [Serratia proteamaculans]MDW5505096.1 translesion error-prone DNA polymerase V autoproteolytic subunit [Pseudomonas lundensis]SUI80668.1 DNA polymerase V subunit UmuD [Serratia liquefaciens]
MTVFYPTPDPLKLLIPFFQDRVQAGFPSPAQDYIEKGIDLNELCISHPAATYFVMATGMSMVDAGIYEGSLLVVDRSLQAKHGDIIIASLAGEYTVKRLCLHPVVQLIPMNPDFPPIVLHDGGDELEVFGVVTFSINGFQ